MRSSNNNKPEKSDLDKGKLKSLLEARAIVHRVLISYNKLCDSLLRKEGADELADLIDRNLVDRIEEINK